VAFDRKKSFVLSDINTVLSAASRHPLVDQRVPKERRQIIIERNTTDQ